MSQAGVQTLIYLAGLQSISPSLYEVAKIEGATTYETFWKVTLPMIINPMNKTLWGKILKFVITVLTAIATTFGIQACA